MESSSDGARLSSSSVLGSRWDVIVTSLGSGVSLPITPAIKGSSSSEWVLNWPQWQMTKESFVGNFVLVFQSFNALDGCFDEGDFMSGATGDDFVGCKMKKLMAACRATDGV